MIKDMFKKILICILVFIIIFNFGLASKTFAKPPEDTDVPDDSMTVEQVEEQHNQQLDGFMDGLAGAISFIPRLLIVSVAGVINIETFAVAVSAGTTDTDPMSVFITPFDIIFNRFVLTDINIFSTDGLDPDGMIATIRESIAMWTGIFTAVAIGILIVVLLVIIVKLALVDDIAERKAQTKEALGNWAISVGLVLLMDVITILIVTVNNLLVEGVRGIAGVDVSVAVAAVQSASLSTTSHILGTGATITYLLLTVATIMFLCKYIYRFFTVSLLVMIAPIVPVPFAINKMHGQKTNTTLNTWLFEFCSAVFSQLLHCVIYICVVKVAFEGFAVSTELQGVEALAPATFAVFAMFFVWFAEAIIRRIFSIKKGGGVRTVVSQLANGTRNAAIFATTNANLALSTAQNLIHGVGNRFGQNLEGNNGTRENPILQEPSIKFPEGHEGGVTDLTGINGPNMEIPLIESSEGNGLLLSGPVDTSAKESRAALDDAIATVTAGNNQDETIVEETHEKIHDETYEKNVTIVGTGEDDSNKDPVSEELKALIRAEIDKLYQEMQNEYEDPEEIKEKWSILEEGLHNLADRLEKEMITAAEEGKNLEEFAAQVSKKAEGTKLEGFINSILQNALYNLSKESVSTEPADNVINVDTNVIEEQIESGLAPLNNEVIQYIGQSLTQSFKLNPDVRQNAIDIINIERALKGQVQIKADVGDEMLTQISVDMIKSNSDTKSSNYEAALAKVKAEGDSSLQSLTAYRENPSARTANALTDAGREVAMIENVARMRNLAVNATETNTRMAGALKSDAQISTEYVPAPNTQNVINEMRRAQQPPQE